MGEPGEQDAVSLDPRGIIARAPMRPRQVVAVAISIMLLAIDGFDVLSISFASPGIAAEWHIDRAVLGVVLSMELFGMAAGSIVIGGIADRVGRRPTILGCLVIAAAGMAVTTMARDVTTLSACRLFTGIGIGGMIATTNAVAAEFSNARRRNLAVALMAAGYPVGAVVGGSIASMLLERGSWRWVFAFGGITTAAFVPLVWLLLPETIAFLAHRRPPNALERINALLRRLGHATVDALPEREPSAPRATVAQLFVPGLSRTTTLLTIAYFTHIMTFYFILKWIPKIVVDMGFAPSAAGRVLVWANVGGATGSIIFSLLTQRFGVRALVIGALLLSTVIVTVFGQGQANLEQLARVAAMVGFCTNAGVVGLYAMFAQSFPTEVRAGGTGFVVGVGRGGSALGPIVAGLLFANGYGLAVVAIVMALGSLVAAITLTMLRYGEQHGAA
jgi:benzoate transport